MGEKLDIEVEDIPWQNGLGLCCGHWPAQGGDAGRGRPMQEGGQASGIYRENCNDILGLIWHVLQRNCMMEGTRCNEPKYVRPMAIFGHVLQRVISLL